MFSWNNLTMCTQSTKSKIPKLIYKTSTIYSFSSSQFYRADAWSMGEFSIFSHFSLSQTLLFPKHFSIRSSGILSDHLFLVLPLFLVPFTSISITDFPTQISFLPLIRHNATVFSPGYFWRFFHLNSFP